MGLLSRISAGFDTPAEKESPQILSGLSFFDFTKKYSLPHSAVFTECNSFFVFSAASNLDGDTILQSISTSDFWEGTVENNKWTFFSKEESNLNIILQFFSDNLKSKINFVNIYRNNDKILLAAYESKPDYGDILKSIAEDFVHINEFNKPVFDEKSGDISIKLNLNEAINAQLGNLNSEIKSILENAFITESIFILDNLIEEPNAFSTDNSNKACFNVYFSSDSHISEETCKAFLKNVFIKLFKKNNKLISYEY